MDNGETIIPTFLPIDSANAYWGDRKLFAYIKELEARIIRLEYTLEENK